MIFTHGSFVLPGQYHALALQGRLALRAHIEVVNVLDQAEEVWNHVADDGQPKLNLDRAELTHLLNRDGLMLG